MLRTLWHKARQVEEVVREAEIKVVAVVNLGHVLSSKLQPQGLNVGLEMGDFVATNHGEDIRGLRQLDPNFKPTRLGLSYLLQHISERNGCNRDLVALSHGIQSGRYLFFATRLDMRRLTTTFLGSGIR